MEIVNIRAKNFLSFKSLDYDIKNGQPVLIQGENLSDPGQESNGSGKSAIMTVIEYALLHTTSRKVNDAELIYWWDGSDIADISLTMFCPIRNEQLMIERSLSVKYGGQSQLSVNGVIVYSFEDKMVAEIDRFIIDWIGISKEDLQNFFILSKYRYTSFFNASNTQLIQLIGRFSNADIIAGIDKDILKQSDALEFRRAEYINQKNQQYGAIEAHKENKERELKVDKTELVTQRLDEIDRLVIEEGQLIMHNNTQICNNYEAISKFNEELLKVDTSLKEVKGKILKVQEELPNVENKVNVSLKNIKQIDESRDKSNQSIDSQNKNRQELLLMIQDIDRNLMGTTICPKCGHEFVVGKTDISVEDERKALDDSKLLLSGVENTIESIKTELGKLNISMNEAIRDKTRHQAEYEEYQTMLRQLNNNILSIEKGRGDISLHISKHENDIITLKQSIDASEKKIRLLNESKADVNEDMFDNKNRIKAIDEQIAQCETKIVEIEEQVKVTEEEIFRIKKWAYTFKEFQQWLSVKTLKVLQGYANKFLKDLGSDLQVIISGFKMKTDGTLSDKINCMVLRDGEEKSFGSFSGGERVRLESAMILTVAHAINSTNKRGVFNFLGMDEIQESIDSRGLSDLIDSLMSMDKTILLTTHIPANNFACEVLKVVKENKVSRIINS